MFTLRLGPGPRTFLAHASWTGDEDWLMGSCAAGVCHERGMPLSSGCEIPIPGLYFCGYHVSATSMLREIGIEAQRIAGTLAR